MQLLKAIKVRLKRLKTWFKRQYKKLTKYVKGWRSKAVIKQTILTFYAILISSFNLGKRSEDTLNKQAIQTVNILIYE